MITINTIIIPVTNIYRTKNIYTSKMKNKQ